MSVSSLCLPGFRKPFPSPMVCALSLLAVSVSAAGCIAQTAPPEDMLAKLFAGELTVVDLTHTLDATNPVWGADSESPFSYDVLAAHKSGRAMMGAFSTAEHYGTHLDAPTHGGDNLATVDELTADNLFGPLVVVDISSRSAENNDYALTIDDLMNWEEENGPMPDRAIVLAFTGWSELWNDHSSYLNRDEEGRLRFPGFSEEAALFLVNERNILGIGIDNMSVDPGAARGFPAHAAVNGNGKFHLENVANVHQLPASGAYLIVAPVKVGGGSGGPVRLFAVIP